MKAWQILQGDCLDEMEWMANESVQCCVTSPPYFGLRDYGHAGQIGLETSPAEYVHRLVDVFREVRRVLKPDGTLWLNLGDSYNGYMANQRGTGLETKRQQARKYIEPGAGLRTDTMKNKDLMGIPWRVAFALQEDGWYLRQDIIWHKPNPMPESVRDRCTKAHEYIFLFSKSPKYYFDNEAMKEPASGPAGTVRKDQTRKMNATPLYQSNRGGRTQEPMKQGAMGTPEDGMRNRRSVWTVPTRPYKGAHFAVYPPKLIEPCILAGSRVGDVVFDPFAGSGTTGVVAVTHGRRAIMCELNAEYAELIKARIAQAEEL